MRTRKALYEYSHFVFQNALRSGSFASSIQAAATDASLKRNFPLCVPIAAIRDARFEGFVCLSIIRHHAFARPNNRMPYDEANEKKKLILTSTL